MFWVLMFSWDLAKKVLPLRERKSKIETEEKNQTESGRNVVKKERKP